jgi:HEAT repeat protein
MRSISFGLGPLASGLLISATVAITAAQQPVIQNGRVEVRQVTAIDSEIGRLSGGDPVWAAWRVPMVAGRRGGCCTYSDDATMVRGCFVEGPTTPGVPSTPQVEPARAAVQLEAGSGLVLLMRLSGGRVERMRTVGDDCPLDAGGRTVYWLQGATAAESLRFLDSVIRRIGPSSTAEEQRLRDSAIGAVAMHGDAAADAILDRLATVDADTNVRRQARSLLGSARGAHGFATLRQLLTSEKFPDIRRQLVSNIGQTREPATAEVLLGIARTDADSHTRAEAAYWLPQRGAAQSIQDTLAIVNADAADLVKQRGVQGLARASTGDATTTLLDLARTSQNAVVRKEAISALGRSRDPRALAYLEGLLK